METFEIEHHEEMDNYRLLDAAETLVNLQSMQEQQQQQQQQIQDSGNVIYITNSPSNADSLQQISPLSSPILHQLTAPNPYAVDPESKSDNIELRVETELDLRPFARVRTPDNGFDLSIQPSSQLSVVVPMGPPGNPGGDSPFTSPGNSYQQQMASEIVRPPPPPPNRRGRGRGRGAGGGERGGRGRGRGRGRGAKAAGPAPDTHSHNHSLNGDPGGLNGDDMGLAAGQPASSQTPSSSANNILCIGDFKVNSNIFAQLLNTKKLALLNDPEVLAMIDAAQKLKNRKSSK